MEGHPFLKHGNYQNGRVFCKANEQKYRDWSPQYTFNGKPPTTAVIQSFGGIGANVGVAVLDKCDDRSGELQRERSITHYSNLATHVIEEKGTTTRTFPRDGKIISLARIAMPFIS